MNDCQIFGFNITFNASTVCSLYWFNLYLIWIKWKANLFNILNQMREEEIRIEYFYFQSK